MDTIFSRIVRKELPANIVYEDDEVLAFHDNNPQAPIHVLIIPKSPYTDVLQAPPHVIARLFQAVQSIVKDLEIESTGFRIAINTGQGGGQTVFHLHLHLLAGRPLHWPPG
jgi:histidine triad (HIT) family protein